MKRLDVFTALAALLCGPLSAAPQLKSNGVVNAASFKNQGSPGGLARGSLVSLFGTGLGPADAVTATSYPLATTLGGVSVRIGAYPQGSVVEAFPVFVRQDQINFLVPSNSPLGLVTIQVTYNGESSLPAIYRTVDVALGIFTFQQDGLTRAVAQNYVSDSDTPLNLSTAPAHPGQAMIVYGTGLGPIPGGDAEAPPAADLHRRPSRGPDRRSCCQTPLCWTQSVLLGIGSDCVRSAAKRSDRLPGRAQHSRRRVRQQRQCDFDRTGRGPNL